MAEQLLRLDEIDFKASPQPRKIEDWHVDDLCEKIKAGITLPPIRVYTDGKHKWIGGGRHRYKATEQAGEEWIICDVHGGSWEDCFRYAVSGQDDASHGLTRSPEHKREAVRQVLERDQAQHRTQSDNLVAIMCRVSDGLVARLRAAEYPSTSTRGSSRTGADGKKRKPTKKPAVYCDACFASGPVRGCPDCKAKRAGTKQTERTEAAKPKAVIPDRLQAIFDCVPKFEAAARKAKALHNLVHELEHSPAYRAIFKRGKKEFVYSSVLLTLCVMLGTHTPKRPCPVCGGAHEPSQDADVCKGCHDKGYQTAEEAGEATI